MEENTSTGISVFHQICEINDLDPQAILQEAQERLPERQMESPDAEFLIRTAYERRAKNLLKEIPLKLGGK